MAKIHKFVITGGPCAGKTTALSRLKLFFENRGYFVITVPEASTFAVSNGVFFSATDQRSSQMAITTIQTNNEMVFNRYAEAISKQKDCEIIIFYDRALIDGSAYVTPELFAEILDTNGLPPKEKLFERYDAVFYLVTAAIGAEKFFENDSVRLESLNFARVIEAKTMEAWKPHKNLFVFDNENKSFEQKMREVVSGICRFLGITPTAKLPKRFLLESAEIPSTVSHSVHKVEKIFLQDSSSQVHSAAKSGLKNGESSQDVSYSFIKSTETNGLFSFMKKSVTLKNNQRIAKSENTNYRQFKNYETFADPERSIVRQTRRIFNQGGVRYEICEYEAPESCAGLKLLNVYYLENEAEKKHEPIPEFLKVSTDVSKQHQYCAHFLSLIDKKNWDSRFDMADGNEGCEHLVSSDDESTESYGQQ